MLRAASIALAVAVAAGCEVERVRPSSPPLAFAGFDDVVEVGREVLLDAGLSHDPGGAPLAYTWHLEARPPGSRASLDTPRDRRVRLVPDVEGLFVVSLAVDDGEAEARDLVALEARAGPQSAARVRLALSPASCRAVLGAGGDCDRGDGRATFAPRREDGGAPVPPKALRWRLLRVPAGVEPTSLAPVVDEDGFHLAPPRPGAYWIGAEGEGPELLAAPAVAALTVFAGGPPASARPRAVIEAVSRAAVGSRILLDGRPSEAGTSTAAARLELRWSLRGDPSGGADRLDPSATGCLGDACRVLVPSVRGRYLVELAAERGGTAGATAIHLLEVE